MDDDATSRSEPVISAHWVLPGEPLAETVGFFTSTLGFRIQLIYPADDPACAELSGHGMTLRLERDHVGHPGHLRLACAEPERLLPNGARRAVAPNGTVIELVDAHAPPPMPVNVPKYSVTHLTDGQGWGTGRAGMQYRDLVPQRHGGRFIASHIRIPGGGPVPDYVHYHHIRFQMIYCYQGWVRVVYEDQGEPFVLHAGDCVLQPPHIRHRVLESSPGLEVVEIGCPAEHETRVDHELELPTGRIDAERDFGGQRFVRHVASEASWGRWREEGFECRDLGIEAATEGLAGVRVARPATANGFQSARKSEFQFGFVLSGAATLAATGEAPEVLSAGSAFTLGTGQGCSLTDCSGDFELLDITLPARI